MFRYTKHNSILSIALLISMGLTLNGCTWVKKTPEAAKVRIVPADRVADCTKVGNVTTTTVDNVSIINRNAPKVKSELETLAQIEAADSGADTIVATTKIVDGRQTFAMYRCL